MLIEPAEGKKLVMFNKPYGVLSQFSGGETCQTLKDYIDIDGVYPAGRLDKDSEGLLLLTDDGALQAKISHPKFKLPKTYWVQIEGEPVEKDLMLLRQGIRLKDGLTKPAQVEWIKTPDLWQRNPPVRFRKTVPTTWLAITIREGRNRQVRRMTAAIGYPTLRLVRISIGNYRLTDLSLGTFRLINNRVHYESSN